MDTDRTQVGRQDFVGDADASSLAPPSRASTAPKPDAARRGLLPKVSEEGSSALMSSYGSFAVSGGGLGPGRSGVASPA